MSSVPFSFEGATSEDLIGENSTDATGALASVDSILDSISEYARNITASVESALHPFSSDSVTVSHYVTGSLAVGPFGEGVQVGHAKSFNFANMDYASWDFKTITPYGSAPLPGAQSKISGSIGVGLSIGIGDSNGHLGKSNVATISAELISMDVAWNHDYIGVDVNIGISGGPGLLFSNKSQTTLIGGISSGNLGVDFDDLEKGMRDYADVYRY